MTREGSVRVYQLGNLALYVGDFSHQKLWWDDAASVFLFQRLQSSHRQRVLLPTGFFYLGDQCLHAESGDVL